MRRVSEREDLSIRPLNMQLGQLQEADGSANLTIGNTSVVCSIYGPSPSKQSRKENPRQLTIDVDFSCPEVGLASGSNAIHIRKERLSATHIQRVLESAVDLSLFPRLVLLVNCTIISDDGSALSAAINCAVLALLNAGIPMLCTPTAVTIAAVSVDQPRLLIDPTREEESSESAMSLFTFAYSNYASSSEETLLKLRTTSSIDRSPGDPAICLSWGQGQFTREQLNSALLLGQAASVAIIGVMKQAVACGRA